MDGEEYESELTKMAETQTERGVNEISKGEKNLDNEFKKKLGQWELSVSNWTLYYNMVFNHYERALFNTFDTRNPMSLSEKIRFNNSILCKSSFIEALNNTTRYIHPVYRLAYHLKNYRIIMLANKVNQFIR